VKRGKKVEIVGRKRNLKKTRIRRMLRKVKLKRK